MQRVVDPAFVHTGSAAISLNGPAQQRYTAQFYTFRPGATAARVYFKLPAGVEGAGTVQLSFNLSSAEGTALTTIRSQGEAVVKSAGEWATASFAFMLPEAVNQVPVGKVQFVLLLNGIPQVVPVYLDDAAVYQAATP